jgi:hypothetical protein
MFVKYFPENISKLGAVSLFPIDFGDIICYNTNKVCPENSPAMAGEYTSP